MQFYFKDQGDNNSKVVDTLYFVNSKAIFKLNFENENIKIIHTWTKNIEFEDQPSFFILTDDQKRFCVASRTDGVWYDSENDNEVDLDELHKI